MTNGPSSGPAVRAVNIHPLAAMSPSEMSTLSSLLNRARAGHARTLGEIGLGSTGLGQGHHRPPLAEPFGNGFRREPQGLFVHAVGNGPLRFVVVGGRPEEGQAGLRRSLGAPPRNPHRVNPNETS